MSDPRSIDPRRFNRQARFNRPAAVARTDVGAGAAAPTWTTLWTWLAAIAASAVILGLVFGYSRSSAVRSQPDDPATTGSASGSVPSSAPSSPTSSPTSSPPSSVPSAPLAAPHTGDVGETVPAPMAPAAVR